VITQSYATVSPAPPRAPLLSSLGHLFKNGQMPPRAATPQDVLYRAVHTMTARGAFRSRLPITQDRFEPPSAERVPERLDDTANDGIVNTLRCSGNMVARLAWSWPTTVTSSATISVIRRRIRRSRGRVGASSPMTSSSPAPALRAAPSRPCGARSQLLRSVPGSHRERAHI